MINKYDWLKIKKCKKNRTFDINGKSNGFLIDILNKNDEIMLNRKDELFQQFYITTVFKNTFKGIHVHPTKIDTLHCVYGKFCLVLYPKIIKKEDAKRAELDIDKFIFIEMGGDNHFTISYPSKYPHGFFGIDDTSIIINYRNPAWTSEDTYQYDIECKEIYEMLNTKYKKLKF